jgi:hypothetical protein
MERNGRRRREREDKQESQVEEEEKNDRSSRLLCASDVRGDRENTTRPSNLAFLQ